MLRSCSDMENENFHVIHIFIHLFINFLTINMAKSTNESCKKLFHWKEKLALKRCCPDTPSPPYTKVAGEVNICCVAADDEQRGRAG